jgi:glutamate synthase domain-containing protein 1/glutamate synthase domain-containing protein 3
MGLSREELDSWFCLQVAAIDESAAPEIHEKIISRNCDILKSEKLPLIKDWRDLPSLEVKPPAIHRYFVRAKKGALDRFIKKLGLEHLDRDGAEEEFLHQMSVAVNRDYYAMLTDKRAFVMSLGRNMCILKIVGYAEDVVRCYMLDDFKAHAWIAHQRYPTRGRLWHPGGAHPFPGMDMALVHNGDFANYHSASEYLWQHGIAPMFLTDTETAALQFDLLSRIYRYPLEYIIEALAPTTEHDFDLLPERKQRVYREIQRHHVHSAPDGPWFFIIARNQPRKRRFQLIGITDTAMLRPQVFALMHTDTVQIGLVCSEKQAIDAALQSMAAEDPRFCPVADRYWNARGGSFSDGGSFIFSVDPDPSNPLGSSVTCADKFGNPVTAPQGQSHCDMTVRIRPGADCGVSGAQMRKLLKGDGAALAALAIGEMPSWPFDELRAFCDSVAQAAASSEALAGPAVAALTTLVDRRYDTGAKRRASVLRILHDALHTVFLSLPPIQSTAKSAHKLIGWDNRGKLRAPRKGETTLVINAAGFDPELDNRDSRIIVDAYALGWKRFVTFNLVGQRFHGVGLGPETEGVRIDVYDSSGDYLGSGINGLEIHVHGNGQDQLGQIIKRGKLVVHGDVGQTFMYGAKGGEVFVLGNAAGRPLINAVGRPRVVINGTCLDYLAESFMAGDPLNGGGFVILNGLACGDDGRFRPLERPYPGSNLFSLASGGAIYIRDPHKTTVEEQLNGGGFFPLTGADWAVMLPMLEENARLFGISVDDLLTVDGKKRRPEMVYRKVAPANLAVLAATKSTDESAAAAE